MAQPNKTANTVVRRAMMWPKIVEGGLGAAAVIAVVLTVRSRRTQ